MSNFFTISSQASMSTRLSSPSRIRERLHRRICARSAIVTLILHHQERNADCDPFSGHLRMSEKQPPLTDLRVLDLGNHAAAALASMVLADFGAEVSAVAPPNGAVATHPAAPMLLRGKRVLPAAQGAEFERALAAADVVITTLGPDDAAPAINERQIHLNISGWGLQGPYARYPMREGLVAARSGRMLEFQMQNGRLGPVYAAVQVATLAASQLGVQGILSALLSRDSSGRGQRVETSLLQGLIPYDVLHLTRRHLEPRFPAQLPPQPGATRPPILGYQPVQGQDGRWLQLGNIFDHLFLHYLELTGLTAVPPAAERGKPNQSWTPESQDMVRIAMLKTMRERPASEWMKLFNASGNVAAAPFQTTQEALDDPDMVIPGDVVDCEHPQLGTMRWLGPIGHLQATPARIRVYPDAAPEAASGSTPPATPKRSTTQSNDTPLKGVTVLEFASVIATPLAMAGLSELGARVIKIEPIGGDPGRWLNGMMSQHIIPVKPNAGKESICIELKSPKGREIMDRLLPKADLIAHNFRPGVPEKLGFGYERARSFNPKVVWVSANGYHPSAPGADRPCAHPIPGAQCGGVMHQVGSPLAATDDIAALVQGAFSLYRANDVNPDPNTSMIAGSAALLGLHAARRLGIGQQINVDMMQASLYANFDDALRYAGKPPRAGVDADLRGLHALARLYECRSGWIYLEIAGDDEFRQLCAAIQRDALCSDARFASAAARRANDAALIEQLAAAFRSDDATTWEARLAHLGCVQADAAETGAFWHDNPHVQANGLVLQRDHPRYGPYLRHGPLMTFSDNAVHCGPAGLAGDHTDQLLQELGYSATDIAQLRAEKVVWSEDSSRLPY
jgi:crotonobetainyl-CoA:carnitine CoA-transferase CaiB-like acyl-CoA transferase